MTDGPGTIMDDRHLEMLHRLDERVKSIAKAIDQNHIDDTTARAAVKEEIIAHRAETDNLHRRIEALERFRKTALALVAAISSAVTMAVHKVVAAWWS